MKPSRAVIAGAAVAGLLTGSLAVRAYAASTSSASSSGHAGISLHTMAEEKQPLPKHACQGQNECKGQGGCKSGGGPGKNSCKGREVAQPTEASRLNSSNQALAAHIWAGLGRFRQGGTASALCRASGRSGDSSFGQSLVCCGCRAFGGLDG